MAAQAPDFRPGQLLPGTKYRVVKQLGAGGMGVVYQVVKPPEIQGVLKLMSTELTDHQEFRTRFFDEVRVLAQLDHPNIVRVFDYDSLTDGTPYYVMEMLHGRTVRDVLATMGTMPPRVAFEVTRQLCEALHCAHTHDIPVIHRDIKPENIFLHAPRHGEPVVKLIDFGVVAVADRQHDGTFVGTWKYAAPEQIRGMRATPATDLYAVGLVLYEMLCGIGPFEDKESGTLVSQAHLYELPPPVSKFAPWVPASIVALIASALSKDPKQRPKDAYAFAERLFELEWANDGKDPHDHTSEGPPGAASGVAARAPGAPPPGARPPGAPPPGAGPGPLSRVLSTAEVKRPSSKNLVAAAPAADRLGDVPLIGIPQEARHDGPTLKGMGNTQEPTSPGEDALLAGLGARPEFRSKKAKESGPTLPQEGAGGAGGDGKVVIRPRSGDVVAIEGTPLMPSVVPSARPGAGFGGGADASEATTDAESRDATTGKIPRRAAPDPVARPDRKQSDTDTFASQESDARRAPSKTGRLAVPIALAAMVLLGVGGFFALRGGRGTAARDDGHASPDPRGALVGATAVGTATAATESTPNVTAAAATTATVGVMPPLASPTPAVGAGGGASAAVGLTAPTAPAKSSKGKGAPNSLASQRSASPSAPATASHTPSVATSAPPAAGHPGGNPAPAKSAKPDDSFIRGL